jgi:hypothetical protein
MLEKVGRTVVARLARRRSPEGQKTGLIRMWVRAPWMITAILWPAGPDGAQSAQRSVPPTRYSDVHTNVTESEDSLALRHHPLARALGKAIANASTGHRRAQALLWRDRGGVRPLPQATASARQAARTGGVKPSSRSEGAPWCPDIEIDSPEKEGPLCTNWSDQPGASLSQKATRNRVRV